MSLFKNIDLKLILAIGLMLISNLGYLGYAVPLLNIPLSWKIVVAPAMVLFGHITYNLGLAIAGVHILCYLRKKHFSPRLVWNQIVLFWQAFRHLLKHHRFPKKKADYDRTRR